MSARIVALYALAVLVELLTLVPLALGFVLGVLVAAAVRGYTLGRGL